MANRHRGEVDAELGGRTYRLCLTLGALAELESRFEAGDLAGLLERLGSGRLAARDMIRILGAGLRGGGNEIADEEVARFAVAGGASGYARIVGELLAATFGDPSGSETSRS
jgi:hypothetical protein